MLCIKAKATAIIYCIVYSTMTSRRMFGAGPPDARYRPGKEGVPPTFAFGASHDLLRPIPRKTKEDDSKSTLVPFDLRHYHLRTIIVRGDYHMYGLGAIYTKSKPLPSSQFNGIYKMEEPEFLSVDENRIIIHNYLPFCDRAPSRNLLAPRSRYLDRSITVKHKWIDSTTLHILNRYNEIAMVLNFRHSETGPYFAGTKLYPPRGEFFERFPVYFEEKNRMIFGIVSSNPKDQNTVLVEGGLNSSEGLFAFNLAADETIVSIKVTYNSHRTCIQNLCFETSEGKKYGMFGGPSATPTAELFAAPKAESLKYFGGYVNGLLKSLVVHSTCPWDRRRDLLLLQASLGNLHGTPERGMQKVFREGLLFSTIALYL